MFLFPIHYPCGKPHNEFGNLFFYLYFSINPFAVCSTASHYTPVVYVFDSVVLYLQYFVNNGRPGEGCDVLPKSPSKARFAWAYQKEAGLAVVKPAPAAKYG
jgi:hypothetical protein